MTTYNADEPFATEPFGFWSYADDPLGKLVCTNTPELHLDDEREAILRDPITVPFKDYRTPSGDLVHHVGGEMTSFEYFLRMQHVPSARQKCHQCTKFIEYTSTGLILVFYSTSLWCETWTPAHRDRATPMNTPV